MPNTAINFTQQLNDAILFLDQYASMKKLNQQAIRNRIMKIKAILLFFATLVLNNVHAQDTLSVLFLGNSYTSYNNLPQLVQSLSNSAGKTLIIDSNMPGGYPMSGHLNDATTFSKISQGNWDYVILQEQSQIPTIDFYRYNDMYPAITDLKLLIEQYNPCARLITYMTWGRRFGGQQCDPSNTYCSPVFTDLITCRIH